MLEPLVAAQLVISIPPSILIYMLRIDAKHHDRYNLIKRGSLSCTDNIIRLYLLLIFMLSYSILLICWFELHEDFLFYSVITFLSMFFLRYLQKESKYKRYFLTNCNRLWIDKLVITSTVYALASVYALVSNQNQFSLMCLMTSIGSTLYHLSSETMYFNLDNIFATSLFLVFLYTLVSSYYHHEMYFHLGMVGLPVSLFLLVHCGMPADIVINYCSEDSNRIKYCTRTNRHHYELLHNVWHLASCVGPFMTIWYMNYIETQILVNEDDVDEGFAAYNADSDQVTFTSIGSMVHTTDIFKYLHYISILISILINVICNYVGIMPVD